MARQRLSPLFNLFLFLFFAASTASAARNLPPAATSVEAGNGGYVVVIDAGSTGSRAHVYRWKVDPLSSSLLPEITPAAPSLKREPGLSVTRPEDVAKTFKPLLEHAAAHVPSQHHSTTDVLVLATAGLRALPSKEDRDARLQAASDAVASLSPFPRPRRGAVATLRGVDEGALAWVAANAAAGTLIEREGEEREGGEKEKDDDSSSPSEGTRKTLGIAEVGGTSMQVTFEVAGPAASGSSGKDGINEEGGNDELSSSSADLFHLELPNVHPQPRGSKRKGSTTSSKTLFRLFSRSWEGLGHEAARATTAAAVSSLSSSESSSSSSGSNASPAGDPCVPPGAVVPLPPGVVSASADLPSSSPPPSGVGTGDFTSCRRAASEALRLSCALRPDHCPLPSDASSRTRPPPLLSGMQLLGIENLRHTANALGLLAEGGKGGGRPTLREIVEAGKRICSGGKKQEEEKEGTGKPLPLMPVLKPVEAARHCFGAAFSVALLHDAFGIGLDERGVEFSGSVVSAASSSSSISSTSSTSSSSLPAKEEQQQQAPERVTPEWTSAAAALAAADVVAAAGRNNARGSKFNGKKRTTKHNASPLPFEALLLSPGETTPTRFLFHRRRHHPLARFFLVCGVFATAAVAVRSLAEQQQQQNARQQRAKRSSAAGGGDFSPSSSFVASDTLGSGDGTSPHRGGGGGSKLSKRGGATGTLDLSAEAAGSGSPSSSAENP